jgi:hypothetical protein
VNGHLCADISCVVSVKKERIAPLPFFHGCRKRQLTKVLIVLKFETDYDQAAIGLPHVMSAVFFISVILVKCLGRV